MEAEADIVVDNILGIQVEMVALVEAEADLSLKKREALVDIMEEVVALLGQVLEEVVKVQQLVNLVRILELYMLAVELEEVVHHHVLLVERAAEVMAVVKLILEEMEQLIQAEEVEVILIVVQILLVEKAVLV